MRDTLPCGSPLWLRLPHRSPDQLTSAACLQWRQPMELVTAAWIAAALGIAKVGTTAGILAFFSRRRSQRNSKADGAPVETAGSDTDRLLDTEEAHESMKDR